MRHSAGRLDLVGGDHHGRRGRGAVRKNLFFARYIGDADVCAQLVDRLIDGRPEAVALGLVSAALYGCEYFYYRKYTRLDGNDLKTNPDTFGATFGIARNCEYGAGISLGLAGVLFCMTFFW